MKIYNFVRAKHGAFASACCALSALALLAAPSAGHAQAFGFGTPVALNSNASTDSGHDDWARPYTDGAGNWIAVWQSPDSLGSTIGFDQDILWSRSTDNGVSWSSVSAIHSNAASDSGQDYFPRAAYDGAGNWVVVWQSDENLGGSIGTDSDILVITSSNGGATWSAPAILNTNAGSDTGNDYDPEIATDGAGNWVVVWESAENIGGTVGTDIDIAVARSTDNGATWSAPAILNSTATIDATPVDFYPDIATDGAGNWVTVWYSAHNLGGTIGTDQDMFVSTSTDNGVSWSPVSVLNSNAGTDSANDFIPSLETDGVGNWIACWFSADSLGGTIGTDNDILFARSTDNGLTWSAVAPLNSNAATDSGADSDPNLYQDGSGDWIAVWPSTEDIGGAIGSDFDILVSRSTDNGVSWSAPAALNSNASTDTGNDNRPALTTDGAGNWVTVWNSNENLGGTVGTDIDIFVSTSSSVPVELSGFDLE